MQILVRIAIAASIVIVTPSWVRAAEDVPFVTTPDNVTLAMLEAAEVGPRDYVIDLGSGDGRIVIVAAKRFGARGLGVEIVPDLVRKSRENARAAGVGARAEFREQDLFKTDLSKATVVTLYLLPDVNLQLRPKLLALRPGTRVVSHDWDMGDWRPEKTLTLAVPDKVVGIEKSSRVHLWIVPARIAGAWCGTGNARGSTLELAQKFQDVRGELRVGGDPEAFVGELDGKALRGARAAGIPLHLVVDRRGRLVVSRSSGPRLAQETTLYVRRKGDSCR